MEPEVSYETDRWHHPQCTVAVWSAGIARSGCQGPRRRGVLGNSSVFVRRRRCDWIGLASSMGAVGVEVSAGGELCGSDPVRSLVQLGSESGTLGESVVTSVVRRSDQWAKVADVGRTLGADQAS